MMRSTLLRCLALILLVACTVVVAHDHGHHGHGHDHGHGHAHGDDKPANKYSREANQDGPSVDEMAAQKLDEVAEVQARMQKENEERLQSQQAQQQAKNTVSNAQLIADKKRALEEAKARAVANQKMRTEALEKKKLQEQEAQRLQAVKEQAEAEERRLEQERQDKEKREEEERLAINQRLREEKEVEERLKQEAEQLEREQREERERKEAEERERLEREQRERHEAEERERAEREERERKEAEERHAAEVQAQAEEENRRKVQELLEQEQAKAREEQEEQERVRREQEEQERANKKQEEQARFRQEQEEQERIKKEEEEQERVRQEQEEQERVAQAQKDAEAQADATKIADQETSQNDGNTDTFAADSAATTPIEFGKLPITTTQKALVATGLVSVLPVFILPFVPIDNTKESQRLLNVLLAFASGGLMGDVFLHLLPHALFPHSHGGTAEDAHAHSHGEVNEDAHAHNDDGAHNHDHTTYVGLWVLAGFMSFFLIEKIMRNGSNGGHEHSHATPAAIFQEKPALVTVVEEDESEREVSVEPPVRASVDRRSRERRSMSRSVSVAPLEVVEAVVVEEVLPQQPIAVAAYLNLVADFSHNFTDGLAIAAAYLASDALGFSTMLAILFHEIPHEVGDYAILIRSGFSRPKAMVAQLSTAIGAMLGAVVGLKAQEFMHTTAWILPLTAGGFIYIATTTVIPDLLTDCSYGQTFLEILAMCTGVGMMVVIAQFEE